MTKNAISGHILSKWTVADDVFSFNKKLHDVKSFNVLGVRDIYVLWTKNRMLTLDRCKSRLNYSFKEVRLGISIYAHQ